MYLKQTVGVVLLFVLSIIASILDLVPLNFQCPQGVQSVLYSTTDSIGGWNVGDVLPVIETDTLGVLFRSYNLPNPRGGTSYTSSYDDSLLTYWMYSHTFQDYYQRNRWEYTYSDNGLLKSSLHYYASGMRIPNSRWSTDTVSIKLYDEEGNNFADSLYVSVRGAFKGVEDTLFVAYEYDEHGMLVKETCTNVLDSSVEKIKSYEYVLLPSQEMKVSTYYPDSLGDMILRSSGHYKVKGQTIIVEERFANGDLESCVEVTFDEKNRLKTHVKYENKSPYDDLSNMLGKKIEYRYDGAVSLVGSKGVTASASSVTVSSGRLVYQNEVLQGASAQYNIYSLSGRMVKGGVISGVETGIDCCSFAKGVYLMKITLPNGGVDLMKVELQ